MAGYKNPLDAYPLIFVGAVIAVGTMSNLMSKGFAGSFLRSDTFYHYIASCQLLVTDEH